MRVRFGDGSQAAALRRMWGSGLGTDVALMCEGATLRCHSAVLVAQGEFWEALLCGPMARCAEMRASSAKALCGHCWAGVCFRTVFQG